MTSPLRVVVIGAGPAGLAAATVAAENGCQATLFDDNMAPGGQIWRGCDPAKAQASPHGHAFARWMRRFHASGAIFSPTSSVVDNPAPNVLRMERDSNGSMDIEFDRLILAPGARERFLPFPGWTLPGVTGAGGLQALVKGGLPIAGKRVVIAGSGPLLLAIAANLRRSGAHIQGIFEQASWRQLARFAPTLAAHPAKLVEGVRYRWQTLRSPYKPGRWIVRALGRERIEAVAATNGVRTTTIACDYLACGFHLVPNLELAQLLGCRIDAGYAAVNAVQETSVRGVYCVGEATGVGGLEKAIVEGRIAGLAAADRVVEAARLLPLRQKHWRFALALDRAFAPRSELRGLATPETIVCRCEDVTRAELETCANGRAARLHARCGMGPCQARVCGPATEFLFAWSPASVRPPLYPVRVSTLACNQATRASIREDERSVMT